MVMALGRRIVTSSGRWMISPTTEQHSLQELLDQLHPVHTQHPLRRIGPVGDGGYLVPDDLGGIAACFSPGVGALSGFELECIGFGMRAHLADASVESAAATHPRLDFIRTYIRGMADAESITLDQWVSATEPGEDDLLLQMDIEGDEWGVILSMSSALMARFRIIVVEVHHLDRLFDASSFPLLRLALEKLLEHHVCVHIHPNNHAPTRRVRDVELPLVAEFTFLRTDRISPGPVVHVTDFPHPLDADCTEFYPTMTLQPSLYRAD